MATPTGAPKSAADTGRYDEIKSDLAEIIAGTAGTSDASRGRKVLMALLDSIDGIAQPDDMVNVSFNYSPSLGGQINLTAVLTLTPAPASRPAITSSSSSA